MLAPVIMSKLPQEIKLILTRKFGKDIWAIDKLLTSLREEVEAREKVVLTDNDGLETFETLLNSGGQINNKKGKTFSCVYCEKPSHKSYQYSKITKPIDRKNFLLKQNRCFQCLRSGHQAKICTSKNYCYHCKGKHHSSICKAFKKRKEDSEETHDETTSNFAGNSSTVLLQTAKAKIQNVQKSHTETL